MEEDIIGEAPEPKRRDRGRFVKGVSGNPSGRPKKPRAEEKVDLGLLEVLNQPLAVRVDGKRRMITKGRALAETLMSMALNRDARAIALLTALLKQQKLIEPTPPEGQSGGGVLVVPPTIKFEDFLEAVAEEQAQYRGNTGKPRALDHLAQQRRPERVALRA